MLHPIHDLRDELDGVVQIIVNGFSGLDSFQFLQDRCEMIPQSLINPQIALHDDFPSEQAVDNVVLLSEAGELYQSFQLLIFFGGYPESDGDAAPAMVSNELQTKVRTLCPQKA